MKYITLYNDEGAAVLKVPLGFNITFYDKVEKYSDSLTKCRARIFYKGLNRNRTYITEDFANQLISSLPYTPVKGIFNTDQEDYEGHGIANDEGKIYGIVMANPNFAWEEHLDTDGVTRTYACADVLLYTSLYSEAKLIPQSSQSMEINPYTYKGEWKINEEDGLPYYLFESGSLFGLQVLGSSTEPCFEGAAFYNLEFESAAFYNLDDNKELLKVTSLIDNKFVKESEKMENMVMFRLSDEEKADAIFRALNPNYGPDNDFQIKYFIISVYDEYVLVRDVEDQKYKRIYYTKTENDVVLGEDVDVEIVDVTETEAAALAAMKVINNNSYEGMDSNYNEKINELNTQIENLNSQLEEKNNIITEKDNAAAEINEKFSTMETEMAAKDEKIAELNNSLEKIEAEKVELQNTNADLLSEKEALVEFKKQVETEKKEAILSKYSEHLTDALIGEFREKINDYSISDFNKEVCTAAVENNPTVFSRNEEPVRFYKGEGLVDKKASGLEQILDKYKNGGNK